MKNLSLILNAVLIIAVGYLYFEEFTDSDDAEHSESSTGISTSDLSIAYVNSDTLLSKYSYYEEVSKTIEEKGNKLQQEYARRAEGLQRQIEDYQRTMTNMTIAQARAVEEDLGNKRQNLLQYQESINQQLYQEQAKITQDLYERVAAFLKSYGEEHNLQLVLTYTPGSGVWYANEALNITEQVVEGLNIEYETGSTQNDVDSLATK
ncbi:MAG: OmpH family outer membrane protein [Bacteroidetes bacterium]|nr:MAG: OmpH family outer membrane protein [Bacteroidota bacterium]